MFDFSKPGSLWITAGASVLLVTLFLLWRIWPVLLGSAKPTDAPAVRLHKWNTYLVKLLRKTLKGQLLVGQGALFESKQTGLKHGLATWSLEPTLLPDVEFIALARPGDEKAAIQAIARADGLRELLGGSVRDHAMWGHPAWIWTWPDGVDVDAVVARLTPVAVFRQTHGLNIEDP
ncbi:MAG: hypothetical protein KC613_07165 [Myxococcales bacterium]|nr:hypothetical protein [Myxococcales bacterium]MCB9526486.1 hypothetical protein [Myxococcales bacterium]